MRVVQLSLPLNPENIGEFRKLRAGDVVELTGELYTARDLAHQRMVEKNEFPIPLNTAIFYAGPTRGKPGGGVIGPTASQRMDKFLPFVMQYIKITIGKGKRTEFGKEYIIRKGGIYMIALSGVSAFYDHFVEEITPFAYKDLGAEAIHKVVVRKFPVVVGIDMKGGDIYEL